MKKSYQFLIMATMVLTMAWGLSGCKSGEHNDMYLGVKVSEITQELQNHLNNWYPRIVDSIHGGYWTNFEYDWTRSQKQEKMLVSQARGLWTASRAVELYPDNHICRKAADHGFEFLTTRMWDSKDGGFCQYYFPDSTQVMDPSYKLIYGNAFALYALAQYARINPDPAVLAWVKKTFDWLEQYAHDPVNLGYFNVVLPGHPTPPTDHGSGDLINRVRWSGADQKDQNTSIHLLEALTTTCQVLPDSLVKARLDEMLTLVRDTITDPGGYLHLYFTRDWKALSNRDSSRSYILQHIGLDHISFGHNIETAYLLADASEKLNGSADTKTLRIAKNLLDHTLANGFDKDYYGLYDKGYIFPGAQTIEIVDSTKTWWAEAEAWHALALFSTYYPGETAYQTAFQNMWKYIRNEIIDPRYGGWYNSGLDKNPENKTFRKAHAWKSCYHDGRALFQVVQYAGSHY